MFSTILVPLDGSPLGERALPFATALARRVNGRLILVRAATDWVARLLAEAELEDVTRELVRYGLLVETHVREGPPGSTILVAARTWRAEVIAMSTHGRSGPGRMLYGSVADHVLRHASVPVLLLPPGCSGLWSSERFRILVPLDGSRFAEAALTPAAELAVSLGAAVLLTRVVTPHPDPTQRIPYGFEYWGYRGDQPGASGFWDPHRLPPEADMPASAGIGAELDEARAYLEGVAARLRQTGARVDVEVTTGHPAHSLASTARDGRIDLIVMATHGRGGVSRLVLGSIATELLRLSTRPLLLVRPVRLGEETVQTAGTAGRAIAEKPAT